MREPVDLRRQRILAAVQARGTARVRDLAAELQVSVVTIRRDVEELTREGRLRRGHGVVRSTLPAQELPERVGGDGDTVAVVVPERHSYLYEALHGARTVLDAAGVRVALHIAPQVPGAERPQVERALADGARGVLLAPRWRSPATEEADYRWLAELDVPTVLMERRPPRGSALHAMDSVCSDHWYGAHLAVEHLVGLGHRRLVFATRDDSPTARTLRAALAEIAGAHPLVEEWVWTLSASRGGLDREPTEVTDLAAVLRKAGATAAVLHGDVDALMLVQQLAGNGVRVPEDCSVVAYDDVVAGLGSPPLTAVSPPKGEVGRVAAELLLRRIDDPGAGGARAVQRIELLPALTVRGSTRPA
ncbi:substrate-binding domain-containing protein [Streptomyces coacervatus]|uniref:Substrate-binding domain-containing protein n=1 Tax=Streptomyces coacervatus TaxID=647381 RepID=A0ABP7I6X9_9ACTN|nr:substrate-binding domain-containing protein [Streptomyces coacervatus]MDF2266208.1 substrate-binding domain-containing protein [Streptomyces coacervatus]